MSMATSALAEAYVMRKQHQQKMNKTTITTEDNVLDDDDDHVSSTTIGCFPTLFKKVHPSSSVAVSDSTLPYVLKKLHKEKIKESEKARSEKCITDDNEYGNASPRSGDEYCKTLCFEKLFLSYNRDLTSVGLSIDGLVEIIILTWGISQQYTVPRLKPVAIVSSMTDLSLKSKYSADSLRIERKLGLLCCIYSAHLVSARAIGGDACSQATRGATLHCLQELHFYGCPVSVRLDVCQWYYCPPSKKLEKHVTSSSYDYSLHAIVYREQLDFSHSHLRSPLSQPIYHGFLLACLSPALWDGELETSSENGSIGSKHINVFCADSCFTYYFPLHGWLYYPRSARVDVSKRAAKDRINDGNDESVIATFTSRLNHEFAIKDLGALNYFLGLEVAYTDNGLFLTQSRGMACYDLSEAYALKKLHKEKIKESEKARS
ncbi:hypothetical protein Tco_0270362, partial [Tanacetum coccineum]